MPYEDIFVRTRLRALKHPPFIFSIILGRDIPDNATNELPHTLQKFALADVIAPQLEHFFLAKFITLKNYLN
jgi:hypothetical protein